MQVKKESTREKRFFATGGRTTEVGDKKLYQQAKKARADKRKKK